MGRPTQPTWPRLTGSMCPGSTRVPSLFQVVDMVDTVDPGIAEAVAEDDRRRR